jgi:hypothetical protein
MSYVALRILENEVSVVAVCKFVDAAIQSCHHDLGQALSPSVKTLTWQGESDFIWSAQTAQSDYRYEKSPRVTTTSSRTLKGPGTVVWSGRRKPPWALFVRGKVVG